jgi:hypothetical protein
MVKGESPLVFCAIARGDSSFLSTEERRVLMSARIAGEDLCHNEPGIKRFHE